MSRNYKFNNPNGIYFISFSVVYWIDVFTRSLYKDILIDSLKYCQKEKGLELYAWCIMSNHVHLAASARQGYLLQDIVRDFKKYTSRKVVKSIETNPQESRKEWMIKAFKGAGKSNSNNKIYQFWQQSNHPIELWSNDVIDQKIEYIHNNPVVAGLVSKPDCYIYSSSSSYVNGDGLIDVIIAS